ncbi:MAG: FapA family protein [Spirochaetia bacterium]
MDRTGSHEGKFELFYRKGWAYLIVHPPEEGGKPVYPEEVENRMKMLGVPKVRTRVIRRIIDEASEQAERRVEWPEGSRLASEIHVRVADDRMTAWVTIDPPKKGAAPPFPEDVVEELEKQGVRFGIDLEEIQRFVGRQDFGAEKVAARGRPPVHGQAAKVEYHFNTNRGKPYLEMDFGRINLKELNFIENVKSGALLAELLDPVEPVDGKDVTGRPLPAEPAEGAAELKAGKNTRLSGDKTKLYAEIDGNAKLDNGYILVEKVVTVQKVNYETGNIRFDGTVVVKGGIADGFVVEATGDIQVGKGVGKVRLRADGNILLKTGINGNDEGYLECGGDLYSKYVERSIIVCRGNAFVEEAIMHSRVLVWKNCVLNGKRSEFIAGSLIVGGSFWCKKLGSIYEAKTHIAVGIVPNLVSAYQDTKRTLDEKHDRRNKAEEQLAQLKRAVDEGKEDERINTAREQLSESVLSLEEEIGHLKAELAELKTRMRASRKSIVVVEDILYGGVTVSFGRLEYRAPDNGARKTILKAGEDEVVEAGFNPHDRPKLDFEET